MPAAIENLKAVLAKARRDYIPTLYEAWKHSAF